MHGRAEPWRHRRRSCQSPFAAERSRIDNDVRKLLDRRSPTRGSSIYERPAPSRPVGLLAELTHRCPLGCPYCSNPLELDRARAMSSTPRAGSASSPRPRRSASCNVHLSGGEPARGAISPSSSPIARASASTPTSSPPASASTEPGGKASPRPASTMCNCRSRMRNLNRPTVSPATAAPSPARSRSRRFRDRGRAAADRQRRHPPRQCRRVGAMVELAIALGARRVEIAHTQYYGWGAKNRDLLMPSREEVGGRDRGGRAPEDAALAGTIVIDHVAPDYHARYPKPCMSGWARRTLECDALRQGAALPCGRDRFPASNSGTCGAFARGHLESFAGLQRLPGRRLDARALPLLRTQSVDFGGCRCQAFMLTGRGTRSRPRLPPLAPPSRHRGHPRRGARRGGAASLCLSKGAPFAGAARRRARQTTQRRTT